MVVGVAGDMDTFRTRLVAFYQIDESAVQVEGDGFSVRTDNATIVYRASEKHEVRAVVLKPHNPTLGTKLKKYAISTADGA